MRRSWRWKVDNDLLERLLRLADPDRPIPENQPPITTFVVRSSPVGDITCATEEYRAWFCRTYGVARDEVAQQEARASQPDQVPGNKGQSSSRELSRFKPT